MAAKKTERSCPTCHTKESSTPGGKARRAVEAAQEARAQSQPPMGGPMGQRPQMPPGQPQRPGPQGGLPPHVQMLLQRLVQAQQGGPSAMQGMQRPAPAMPSSLTGAVPGQIEQAALRRLLTQQALQRQQQMRGGR
jgi:hypothetical protein